MHKRRQKSPANQMTNGLYQQYLDKYLKLPTDLRNDIIYCQRSLIAHVKVHQIAIDSFDSSNEADNLRKKRTMDELETEIYQINAEQQYLFMQVREIIDEFHKLLDQHNITGDRSAANLAIMKIFQPFLNDKTMIINPVAVSYRSTEEQLMNKYLNKQSDILDDQDQEVIITTEPVETIDLVEDGEDDGDTTSESDMLDDNKTETQQVSLLKPMAQRMVDVASTSANGIVSHEAVAESVEPKTVLNEKHDINTIACSISHTVKKEFIPADDSKESSSVELPVSKNVKMCRLNLRQALKKARNVSMAAEAAALSGPTSNSYNRAKSNLCTDRGAPLSKTTTMPTTSKNIAFTDFKVMSQITSSSQLAKTESINSISANTTTVRTAVSSSKKQLPSRVPDAVDAAALKKARGTRGAVAPAAVKIIDLLSSSEDSIPEAETAPPRKNWPEEVQNLKTHPDQYGRERFLQLFGLFTPEMLAQMQQRRSKRRRRNVHNNERADFHYGRIEYGCSPQPEEKEKKKRKVFLLSPRVKRLQSKGPKRANSDKNIEAASSRSNTTSPDGNRNRCNECNKNGGSLIQCGSCEAFYHKLCHRRENDLKPTSERNNSKEISLVLCPTCKRAQVEILKKDRINSLNDNAKELETKMSAQKDRRGSVQREDKSQKTQVRHLIKIDKTIKNVEENYSSE